MSDGQRLGAPRRAVLAGAGAAGVTAALGGCGPQGADSGARPATTPAGTGPAGAGSAGTGSAPATGATPAGTGSGGPAAGALAQVADIPVGGGKIFDAAGVVVTQPQPGVIKAFSTTCTHRGCQVESVRGGTINCPCHGSRFNVADGSVAGGPATRPLPAVAVTVDGTAIKLR